MSTDLRDQAVALLRQAVRGAANDDEVPFDPSWVAAAKACLRRIDAQATGARVGGDTQPPAHCTVKGCTKRIGPADFTLCAAHGRAWDDYAADRFLPHEERAATLLLWCERGGR